VTQVEYETIVIGTGFGGLAVGYELKKAGRDNFLFLEKADGVGGTWRENTYPGVKCDTNSILYSYSWAPNPDWEYKWSRQSQILQYIKDLFLENDLLKHVQLNTRVIGATFDEQKSLWTVYTDNNEITCRYLVSSVGQLHHPSMPNIQGIDDFEGHQIHAAQWDNDLDLNNKNVAVIGSAASAIQLIPEIAKVANKLTVYQRSANWVLPQGDKKYSSFEKWQARYLPFFRKLHRWIIEFKAENILYPAVKGSPFWGKALGDKCLREMKKIIADPEMQEALTPNYPIGAKRVLFSDWYYQTLVRENVELVTSHVSEITPVGVQCDDRLERKHDVIIYATGFKTNPFLLGLDIKGRGGKKLDDHWSGGAHAYLSVTTADFPNLFFTYGPNSNTSHHSIIFKLETQARLIRQFVENELKKPFIEVKSEVEDNFNQEIQKRMSTMTWSKVDASWYKVGDKITNNWPGNCKEYRARLNAPNWSEYKS